MPAEVSRSAGRVHGRKALQATGDPTDLVRGIPFRKEPGSFSGPGRPWRSNNELISAGVILRLVGLCLTVAALESASAMSGLSVGSAAAASISSSFSSSSSSAVMDLERRVSVVLGALLGGGGAAKKREALDLLSSSRRRGVARCRCHLRSTAWISSYSREDESHCARILFRLRLDANFFMAQGAQGVGGARAIRASGALGTPRARASGDNQGCWWGARCQLALA